MTVDHGLTVAQMDTIYEEQVFPVAALNVDTHVDRPTVVFVAGAPGAGKAFVSQQVPERLGGVPMALNGDQVRAFHPDYQQLTATNPALAIEASSGAVDVWLRWLRSDAAILGAHISDETTLRRPDLFLDAARTLRAQGYRVEVQVMATPPQISAVAAIARTEVQIAQTGTARIVPLSYHDQIVDNLAAAADTLNGRPGLIDSLQVINRNGRVLWDGPNHTGPGSVIRDEFTRPLTTAERAAFDGAVRWVRKAQEIRDANPTERRPIEQVAARAPHYTPPPNPTKIGATATRFRHPQIRQRPLLPGTRPKPGIR